MVPTAEKMAGVYQRLYGLPGSPEWAATLQRLARVAHNRRRRETRVAEGRDIGGYRPKAAKA